jgi:hypothetical protein
MSSSRPEARPVSSYATTFGVNPDSGEPYSLVGFEYLADIFDDLTPRVVIQKAAQVGATVMAMLRTVWFLDRRKKSAMYLFPTHRSADRFRRGRFTVMVQRSPSLQGRVKATGAPGHLRVGAAQFYCHGARSRAELMSVPVAYLTLDERDELYRMAGLEGTPWSGVDLARQRLAGQAESWEVSLSTPTIPGHGIAAEFARSDQREFLVRCPHCSCRTPLHWPEALLGIDGPPKQARFCCPLCRTPWDDAARRAAIQVGVWHPRNAQAETHGYQLNQLLSPVAKARRLVKQWQEAQGDPAALQVFHNAVLGLPYLAEGARLDLKYVEDAVAQGGGATMADFGVNTAAGIDVGPQLLHVVIVQRAINWCHLLWAGVVTEWHELEQLLRQYDVRSYVIDAQPETHQARRLVTQYPGGWLCYYRTSLGAQPHQHTELNILRVPRSETLDALYQAWKRGQVIAPANLPPAFVDQLRSLVRVVRLDRRGQARVDYLEAGGPDHYAHAMNYALLALSLQGGQRYFAVTEPGVQ